MFDYVKPVAFIKRIIQISPNLQPGDIIVDFFSGSATTAHAVMESNNAYKYIMVQIDPELDESITSQKVAKEFLKTIGRKTTLDQIGIERIIRAAAKIRSERPDTTADLGFKHFTLKEPTSEALDKMETFSDLTMSDEILNEFGLPTVLATWLVHDGYGFTAPVQEIDFAGYKGYYMNKSDAAIEAIVTKYETDGDFNPENVVLFGYSFFWTELEALKTNLKRLKDTEKNLRINFDIRY